MKALPARAKGFSLLEMIVLLVVASILSAMMYAFFGESLTQGYVPVAAFRDSLDLATAMENLTSDYDGYFRAENALRWRAEEEYLVGDRVRAVGRDFGHFFRCILDGQSGTDEPAWRNIPGTIIDDGGTRWEVLPGELDPVVSNVLRLADGGGFGLADGVVRDYEYGRYGVVDLEFIEMSTGEERPVGDADPRNLLKITLINGTGERLSVLFSTSY
jgi:prepilin-type N-terminal cleavage/methylation domain-containing protein